MDLDVCFLVRVSGLRCGAEDALWYWRCCQDSGKVMHRLPDLVSTRSDGSGKRLVKGGKSLSAKTSGSGGSGGFAGGRGSLLKLGFTACSRDPNRRSSRADMEVGLGIQ
jgi:hypothetical protein